MGIISRINKSGTVLRTYHEFSVGRGVTRLIYVSSLEIPKNWDDKKEQLQEDVPGIIVSVSRSANTVTHTRRVTHLPNRIEILRSRTTRT